MWNILIRQVPLAIESCSRVKHRILLRIALSSRNVYSSLLLGMSMTYRRLIYLQAWRCNPLGQLAVTWVFRSVPLSTFRARIHIFSKVCLSALSSHPTHSVVLLVIGVFIGADLDLSLLLFKILFTSTAKNDNLILISHILFLGFYTRGRCLPLRFFVRYLIRIMPHVGGRISLSLTEHFTSCDNNLSALHRSNRNHDKICSFRSSILVLFWLGMLLWLLNRGLYRWRFTLCDKLLYVYCDFCGL